MRRPFYFFFTPLLRLLSPDMCLLTPPGTSLAFPCASPELVLTRLLLLQSPLAETDGDTKKLLHPVTGSTLTAIGNHEEEEEEVTALSEEEEQRGEERNHLSSFCRHMKESPRCLVLPTFLC